MIPLYSLFTPSHQVLKEQYFMPTLPPDVQLHLRYVESEGAGFIQDESWRRAIIWKVELIIEAMSQHDVFAYSDIDVQFFGSFAEWFNRALAKHDLVFQADAPGPALCAGFFFCRSTDATRRFWQLVLDQIRLTEAREDDQTVARRLVNQMRDLRYACLPPVFYGGGTLTARVWSPGDLLLLPHGLLMHHANFTLGVANKVSQLEYVRMLFQNGEFLPLAEACRRVHLRETFD